MKYKKTLGAPESYTADSVGFVQNRSIPAIILGMLCRFAVAFIGSAGVCLMLDNAFAFAGAYRPGSVFVLCLIFCAVWFLLFTAYNTNGVFFAVTSGVYISAFVYAVSSFGWAESFGYVPLSLWNHILDKLDRLGFTALSGLKSGVPQCDPSTSSGAFYAKIGFYVFCAAASLIFVSCIYKKVKAVPIIITAGIAMTLTFTYNLLTDNLGFVLTVASGFGILVLLYYASFTKDKTLTEDKKKRYGGYFRNKRRSIMRQPVAGLAALVTAALVLAVAAYPAYRINTPAPKLTLFNDVIENAREFFSYYLTGDFSKGDEFDALQKSTEPTPREFEDKKVMTVAAGYPSAVYLRAWTAETYSNNKWISASAEENDIKILPEQITELFYTIVDIDANVFSDTKKADTSYSAAGFIKERVTVKSSALSGNTGFLPSRFSTIYGLTDPYTGKSYDKDHRLKNGVGTLSLSMKDAEYSTVAYSPNYKNIYMSELDGELVIYDTVLPYIEEYANMRLYKKADAAELEEWLRYAIEKAAKTLDNYSLLLPSGSLIYRISDMSDEDLFALLQKLDDARRYEDHVYESCLSVPWSDEKTLRIAAEQAFGGNAGEKPSDIFSCVSRTARYLEKICSYSLSPTGYTNRGSYVAQFLTTAKNGYCVQYASAGALILRCAGIPVRYADGFLASDFRAGGNGYECDVLDSNAHAWIEVYIRGYGWMTFEMTEPMLDGLYRTPGQGNEFIDTEDPVTTEKDPEVTTDDRDVSDTERETRPIYTEPEETTTPSGRTGITPRVNAFIILGVIILCVFAVSTVIFIFISKTAKQAKTRQNMISKAAQGKSDDPENDIKEIGDYIFFMFEQIGLTRGRTELLADFTKRADDRITAKSFAPAAHAIQKNSFGRCADEADCKDVADYALYLREAVKKRMTDRQKFLYCKVLKKI